MEDPNGPQSKVENSKHTAESNTAQAYANTVTGVERSPEVGKEISADTSSQTAYASNTERGFSKNNPKNGTPPEWIAENLPVEWSPQSYLDVPTALTDVSLVALYLHTRAQPDSLKGKLAALALFERFKPLVEACVRGSIGHSILDKAQMEAYYQAGWLGFLESLPTYDPYHKNEKNGAASVAAYAFWKIKAQVIEQLVGDLPGRAGGDSAIHAFRPVMDARDELIQRMGTEPRDEEVARYVAPKLPAKWGTEDNRYKIAMDVLGARRSPIYLGAARGTDEDPMGADFVDPDAKDPLDCVIDKENREMARKKIQDAFSHACSVSGNVNSARQLLVIQVLQIIPVPARRFEHLVLPKAPYLQLAKIAKLIRGATESQMPMQREIEEWWNILWHELYLGKFELTNSWDQTREMFSARTKGSLENWYNAHIAQANWTWNKADLEE